LPFVSTTSGLQPDLDQLDQLDQHDQHDQHGGAGIKLFITSNPNNPTGTVLSPESVARLAQLAVRDDFLVLIDELYARLVYDDVPYTHLAAQPGMADRTITLLGGSKTESLSGYRVGVVVSSAPVIDAVEQTLAMLCLRAPAYAQHVLTKWLVDDGDFVAKRVSELHDIQRSTIEQLLTVPGLVVAAGSGTAYLWPDVSGLGISGLEAARVLQEKAGVVVSPGYQFGPSGINHFRICYARDEREWAAALERMTAALRGES
ncbi:MAG: aminotransferase class I/II-fold pyridoxal phosphate-dependent enzyme, partial [Terracoccus sp.]